MNERQKEEESRVARLKSGSEETGVMNGRFNLHGPNASSGSSMGGNPNRKEDDNFIVLKKLKASIMSGVSSSPADVD